MDKFIQATEQAEDRGHELVNDPPANEISHVRRRTCMKCGRSVLAGDGSVWGSALKEDCTPVGADK